MLQITKDTTTRVAVTLNEKQTLTNPTWLWRFVNDATNIEYTAIITEVSNNYKTRSNLFDITEGGLLVLPSGIYTYYVYEQTSAVNTNYTLADNLCEVGQMKVIGDAVIQYSESNNLTVQYS